jgi:GT2 family glycosyltransferase
MRAIADAGFNVVRTYTLPPDDLLDSAAPFGLRVLAGIYYDDWRMHPTTGRAVHRTVLAAGRRAIDQALARCAGRAEVIGISVGNEVPADIVRVHGIHAVEDVLSQLVDDVHRGDAEMLTTYASYPTTEYLRVRDLDVVSFNVFLDRPQDFRRYLRHLQVLARDSPLLVTEVGVPGGIHGEAAQAMRLEAQLGVLDETGCAGATLFSWTDDWVVDGHAVQGWGFGLTDARRRPKPALEVASRWARRSTRDLREDWPAVSAVVCAYNESALLAQCLDSLTSLDYPSLEIIVCDDGSTDDTAEVARRYPVRLLELPHAGLSAARNAGIDAARSEIMAFIDADACCHGEWPYHLVLSLEEDGVVATGGPNLPVGDVGFVERAVSAAPGAPVEVLLTDDRAEHVPGCNMAFRRGVLAEIGGFDPVYTSAGDDVDVCWKILDRGQEIGFSPAAQVRHHRRSTVRGYLRQQRGYGRAEALLAARHPHRFNHLGQARWRGFIYDRLRSMPPLLRPVVYHGYHGAAPYQPVTRLPDTQVIGRLSALLPVALLAAVASSVLALWWPLVLAVPIGVLVLCALYGTVVVLRARPARTEPRPLSWRCLVAALHLAQPIVRAAGRMRGLLHGPSFRRPEPRPRSAAWHHDRLRWLEELRSDLLARGCAVRSGGVESRWDLAASLGPTVSARITTAVLWSYFPVARVRLRPRAPLLTVLPLVAVSAAWIPVLRPLLLVLFAVALVDGTLLLRKVHGAIRSTTTQAGGRDTGVPSS